MNKFTSIATIMDLSAQNDPRRKSEITSSAKSSKEREAELVYGGESLAMKVKRVGQGWTESL